MERSLPRLSRILLHLTKACNLRCSYCYFSAAAPLPNELTRCELQHLWPQVLLLRPRKLVLTGGEPLLRPDVLALVQDFRRVDADHEVLLCLNSNGVLVTASLAREIAGLVDEVRISIDAMQERNDCLRGKGSFIAAINALSTYYDAGFEPKALITVTSVSMCDLEDLVRHLLARSSTSNRPETETRGFTGVLGVLAAWRETLLPVH